MGRNNSQDMMPADGHEYAAITFLNLAATGITLERVVFFDCMFDRCTFLEAVLAKCSFVSCTFMHCDLSLVQVPNSNFTETSFQDSKVIGVDWTKAGAVSSRMPLSLNFRATILNYSSFFGLNMAKTEIVACTAHDVDFAESNLRDANLEKTDFLGSKFLHTDLTSANFADARNYAIDARANTLTKARFKLPEAVSLLRGLDIIVD